jgi:hypothetical protein
MDKSKQSQRREFTKLIRFSSDELNVVIARARAAGRPVACFIRESSLGSTPRARRSEMSDASIRHLSGVASQLSLLSRAAKEQDLPHAAEFERAVKDVLDTIRQID